MSECLVCAGEYGNKLERATLTSTSADSLAPLSRLVIGRPCKPFRFAAAGADDSITADLDIACSWFDEDGVLQKNGGFEDGLDGWTDASVGASNVATVEETLFHEGAKAAKITLATAGAGNHCTIYPTEDLVIRTGEEVNVKVALRGDGTIYSRFRVYIPELGLYLQSDGTWTSSVTDLWTELTTGYVVKGPLTFTVPSFATTNRGTVTVRLIALAAEASNTGTAYVDDVRCWPSWDAAAFHGVAYGPVDVELRSSDDGFSADDTLVATMTKYSPTMYHRAPAMITDRWARFLFAGTNHEPIEIGEALLLQVVSLASRPNFGYAPEFQSAAVVAENRDGETITTIADRRWQKRRLPLVFEHDSVVDLQEQLREVFFRARGPETLVWIVPDTEQTDEQHRPLYGRIERTWSGTRKAVDKYMDQGLVITEMTFRSQ